MASHPEISLRPLAPSDSSALDELFEQTPDTGQISFTTRFKIDAYTALTALHSDMAGVVAELKDSGQIIGLALVDISERQIEGSLVPCALLNTLKVHPEYRRRGIAGQLAEWRINYVRERFGDQAVILADIQKNNVASERAAQRWCQQFVGQPTTVLLRMRETPPQIPVGMTIRAAKQEELDEITEQQNRFYESYNLYAPKQASSLASWRTRTPLDTPIREIYVAVDATGTPLAGAGVSERARLMALHVGQLPPAMQLVNRVMRLLPPNGVVDEILVDQLWFRADQSEAARALWEWLRWEKREAGSVMRTAFDPRGPLPNVFRLPFWLPKAQSRFAVHSPTPLRAERLIYPYG